MIKSLNIFQTKVAVLAAALVSIIICCFMFTPMKAYAFPSMDGVSGALSSDWHPTSSITVGGKTVSLGEHATATDMSSGSRNLSGIYIGRFDYSTAVDVPVRYTMRIQSYAQWKNSYDDAYDLLKVNRQMILNSSYATTLLWDKFCEWGVTKGYISDGDTDTVKRNSMTKTRLESYCEDKLGKSLHDIMCVVLNDPTNKHTFGTGEPMNSVNPALGDWLIAKGGQMCNPAIAKDWATQGFYKNYVINGRGNFQIDDVFHMIKFPRIATGYTKAQGSVTCDMYVAFSKLIVHGYPTGQNLSTWGNGAGPFISIGSNSIIVTSQYTGNGSADLSVDVEIFFVPSDEIKSVTYEYLDGLPDSDEDEHIQHLNIFTAPRDPDNTKTSDLYLLGSDYRIKLGLNNERVPYSFAMTDIDQFDGLNSSASGYNNGYCEHVVLYDGTSASSILRPGQADNLKFARDVLVTPDTWNSWSNMSNYGVFNNIKNKNSNTEEDKADTGFIAMTSDAWGKYRWYGSYAGTEVMYLDGHVPMCDIKITKKSDAQTWVDNLNTYSLAGAVYGIWEDDPSCSGGALDVYRTDARGTVTSGKLLLGHTYYVKEIYPSPGHNLDETIYSVQAVTDGATYEVNSTDPVMYTNFGIVKGDSQLPGAGNDHMGDTTFEGAQFKVRYYDGYYDSVDDATASGPAKSEGVFSTNELATILVPESDPITIRDWNWTRNGKRVCPLGTYVVQEVKSVDGYDVNGSEYLVKVTREVYDKATRFECEAKRYNVKNAEWVGTHVQIGDLDYWTIDQPEIWRGGMDLMKVDSTTMENWAEGNATLENAEFKIYNVSLHEVLIDGVIYPTYKQSTMVPQIGDYNGRAVGKYNINVNDDNTYVPLYTLHTDKNGLCNIPNYKLPYGTYVIYEITPPNGYLINKNFEAGVEFTIRQHGQMADFVSVSAEDKHYWNDHNGAWDDTISPNPSIVPPTNPPGVTR